MLLAAAATTSNNWPEAAIAIAGIAFVTSVTIVAVWQAFATWRARMAGSQVAEYRRLAEEAAAAHDRTAARLEQVLEELRTLREREERG